MAIHAAPKVAMMSVFGDLRRLADWFSTSPQRASIHIERVVDRVGGTAIPLLGREIRHVDGRRREAARTALARLANDVLYRARVVQELRDVTEDLAIGDEAKVCALGLLSELGERAAARFIDPSAIQHRSALALAAQLSTDADLANAADLMVHQLDHADIVQMIAVMIEAAPSAAYRLAGELSMRLDLPADAREQIAAVLVGQTPPIDVDRSRRQARSRGTHVAVLVDASARLVVVAWRPMSLKARAATYRRWAVLIGATGTIDDCLHDADCETDGDAASLIASLVADGYRVASSEIAHARTVVTAAARLTALTPAADGTSALTSSYYLGRDILDLGDAHMGAIASRARRAAAASLARALEYIGDGELDRGAQLLSRTDVSASSASEHHAATAYVHLAKREPQLAAEALERAIAVEPEWPLHHWNLACALRMLGDASGCFWALRRFVATSAAPTGLFADPDQPGRVGLAERMMAELERTARITGTSLRRRRRKKPLP
jgi:hypothetical protein